jgi:hypothetical protein
METVWTQPLTEIDADATYFVRRIEYQIDPIEMQKIPFDLRDMFKGHYCGYVSFPEPPCSIDWIDYESIVDVHGGVTYYQWEDDTKQYVVGFDCAHAGDQDDPDCQDINWVLNEAKFLGKQILFLAKYSKQYEGYTRKSDRNRLMKKIMKELGELKR